VCCAGSLCPSQHASRNLSRPFLKNSVGRTSERLLPSITEQTMVFGGVPVIPQYLLLPGLIGARVLRPGRPPGFSCCQQTDMFR
jgi:hypothetical protein